MSAGLSSAGTGIAACHQRAPGLSRCACAASAACPPLVKAPRAHRLWVSLIDGSGPGSRLDIFAVNVRLIYALLRRGVWTNSDSFSVHRAWIALSQVKAPLQARPGNTIPSISPMCAQARRRFTQVIHMVVHSKARNTFSSRAGRQRVSVPSLARGGRHAGRGSGLGLDDITHDGGHRMLAAHPAGQAACAPSRRPAVTLTVIPPAARPRYARCRAPSPPALAPGLCQHGHEPEREAPVPIDDRAQQLITGRQRPMPGRWPPGGVPARDGAAPSHAGSHSGGSARACRRRGGSRACRLRPGAAARKPRPCPPGPQIIAAGIPAVAGMPALARRSFRAESGTAPPCMRWRGRAPPAGARLPARGAGLPAPPAFPASPPGGARFQR